MVIVVIRLRNLSNEAHAPHIREFFKGLVIPEGGVQIIGGEDGTAFIIFGSDEDARKAMMLDGSYLCDTPVKLTLSSKAEMNKIIEDSQGDPPAAETHNQAGPELPVAADPHAVVAAYDDPYAVVKPRAVYDQQQQPEEEHEKYIEVIFAAGQLFEQDLKAFFSPLVILYVGIHPGPDERYQTAIIKFSSRYEKHEALKKDGSIIGVVPIKISVPAEKYCYVVESYNAQQMPKPKPAVEYPPESRRVWEPTAAAVPVQREYCVEVYGIPSVATYDILGGFFDIPRHCKEQNMFMEMLDGICKGRAYIDFGANGYEYNRCLLRDRALLMGAPVTVRSIPLRDMVEVFRLNRSFFNQVDFDRNEARKVVDVTFHHLTEYQNRGGSKDFGGQKNKYKGAYQHKPKPATVDPPKLQQQQKTAAQDNGKTTNESVKPSAEKSPDIKSPDAGSDKKSSSSPSESTAEGSSDDVKNDDEVAKEGDSENNNNTEGGTEAGSGEENAAPNTDSPNAEGAVNAEDASSQNKQDHVRPQQNKRKFCVRLANVPYHASDEDIRNFFKGIPIPANGVHILSKGVKKTGHVFVKFASSEHAHQAEKQHEKDFMGRSVLVKTSYVQYLKTIWERVIGPGFPEDKFNEDPHCSTATAAAVRTKSVIEQFFEKIHLYKMDCVHVRNLPPSTLENDIYSILKREQIRVRRIDVIKDHRGQCKGDAYVELDGTDDCFRAVSLHEKVLFFGQPLQFFPISIAQLQKDLDALTAPPKFRDYRGYPGGGYPPRPEGKQLQPPVDPYMDEKAAFYGAAAVPYSAYEKRPRVDPTPYPEVAAAHPDAAYPPPPVGYRPTASPTDPAAGAPAAVRAEAAPRSPSSEYARKYGYMPPYAGGAPADYRIPVEATAPSSTVKMVNLSFDVTQEDIMEFFAPYSPIPKSVRLVYDGQGRLTGEGVLAFPTPEVAKAAVDKLDGQVFLQRKIKLELD